MFYLAKREVLWALKQIFDNHKPCNKKNRKCNGQYIEIFVNKRLNPGAEDIYKTAYQEKPCRSGNR